MKKMLFTAVFALIGFMASAQFMVVADVDFSNDNFEASEVTDFTDIGVGYMINDSFTVGATMTAGDDEDFRVFARYYWNESIYLTANTSTEDFSDNLRVGAGYSFAAYGNFHVEPNYTMNLSEDNSGERNGRLNLGLAYKF
jgi:opacity protein-like surface antigen